MLSPSQEKLQRLLARDVTYLHANRHGQERDSYIDDVAISKNVTYQQVTLHNVEVFVSSDDLLVLRGNMEAVIEKSATVMTLKTAYTAIWQYCNKVWVLVRLQATKMPS